jgi:putative transposase
MARQWRIEYPGALYHVLSRGNGRQDIFLSDKNRHSFLDLLQEVTERFGIFICAYVLMSNHYHLLLKISEANLSQAMQWFGTAYTRRFHVHNHTSGHLFQGRFKSILVENEAYLLRLSCYIHRNPLRAGIVIRLADYPWSSYPFYAYKKKAQTWLSTDLILDQMSGDSRRASYRRMVQHYSDENGSVWEDIKHGLAFGSQSYLDRLKENYLKRQKIAELPQHNRLLLDTDPQKMIEQAAVAYGLDLSAIRNTKRISSQEKDKRDMLIYFLWETGRLSNQNIASLLGMTYSNISRRVSLLRRQLQIDKNLESIYRQTKSQIKV